MMTMFRATLLVFLAVSVAEGKSDVEKIGSGLRLALPAAALAATYAEDDASGRLQLALSVGATAAATYLLNQSVNARTPKGESKAFPSGHASIAFSSAEFLRRRYGGQYGFPAYAVAAFVGWSRLHADEHTVGQVLGGAALGMATSYLITDPRLSVGVTQEAAWLQFNTRW